MAVQWNFSGGSPFDPSSSMTSIDEEDTRSDAPTSFPPSASQIPSAFNPGRRISVSAESSTLDRSSTWTPPVFEKTPEQLDRLKGCLESSTATAVLFSRLDTDQRDQILRALQEKKIPAAGVKIIEQGATGDHFYIVQDGSFDVFVHPSGRLQLGPDGLGNKVTTIGPGGSFGELALMYNAPRAASVVSTSPATVWALDRQTFQNILMTTTFQKRDMFDTFLRDVRLLRSLTQYERGKIADVLETQKFGPGETIIHEGDVGNTFYLLVSGIASVYKSDEGGNQTLVHEYTKGDYFGELALLNNEPRAATVVSKTDVEVASLDKAAFQRLLGSVESIMRRNDPRQRHARLSAVMTADVQMPSEPSPMDVRQYPLGQPTGGDEGVDPLAP